MYGNPDYDPTQVFLLHVREHVKDPTNLEQQARNSLALSLLNFEYDRTPLYLADLRIGAKQMRAMFLKASISTS